MPEVRGTDRGIGHHDECVRRMRLLAAVMAFLKIIFDARSAWLLTGDLLGRVAESPDRLENQPSPSASPGGRPRAGGRGSTMVRPSWLSS
jgi:hypothetical protein